MCNHPLIVVRTMVIMHLPMVWTPISLYLFWATTLPPTMSRSWTVNRFVSIEDLRKLVSSAYIRSDFSVYGLLIAFIIKPFRHAPFIGFPAAYWSSQWQSRKVMGINDLCVNIFCYSWQSSNEIPLTIIDSLTDVLT